MSAGQKVRAGQPDRLRRRHRPRHRPAHAPRGAPRRRRPGRPGRRAAPARRHSLTHSGP
ncbi:hypothetical protein G5V59_23260 [Nocardioides sp. W3-2-3]|nr:hypothetical protein [Nocardioides convexus]